MELTLMVFVLLNHLSFLTTPFLPPCFSNFADAMRIRRRKTSATRPAAASQCAP